MENVRIQKLCIKRILGWMCQSSNQMMPYCLVQKVLNGGETLEGRSVTALFVIMLAHMLPKTNCTLRHLRVLLFVIKLLKEQHRAQNSIVQSFILHEIGLRMR